MGIFTRWVMFVAISIVVLVLSPATGYNHGKKNLKVETNTAIVCINQGLKPTIRLALEAAIEEENGAAASVLCALMAAVLEGTESELSDYTSQFVDKQIERQAEKEEMKSIQQPQPIKPQTLRDVQDHFRKVRL